MGKPLRVLIIEDSEDDALFVTNALIEGGYELTSERVETAVEAMKAGAHDYIMKDRLRYKPPSPT